MPSGYICASRSACARSRRCCSSAASKSRTRACAAGWRNLAPRSCGGCGDGRLARAWHLDEVQVSVRGQRFWLWRAVDEHGVVLEEFLQPRRDAKAAKWLLRRLMKKTDQAPKRIVTDKLRSYPAAKREVAPGLEHRAHKGLNNRAENSHLPFRSREKLMRGYRSLGGLQRFVSMHSAVRNCFVPPARRRSAQTTRYHRLPTPCRRRQRSNPERETFGFRNSRTTQRRSSSGSSSVLRSDTATASCAGVSVDCSRRCVAPVMDAVPLPPFPDRLLGDAIALRHYPGRLGARLDRSPDLRCRCRLLVKRDQHARLPSRTSRRIDLAMKSPERRGAMRSPGTGQLGARSRLAAPRRPGGGTSRAVDMVGPLRPARLISCRGIGSRKRPFWPAGISFSADGWREPARCSTGTARLRSDRSRPVHAWARAGQDQQHDHDVHSVEGDAIQEGES